ncbi:hypothetical protein [Klebsiella aerogenes]|uniref:hypothetical protein n=1 Tax=Klebsiella aerogenes TaxID=548 RepID=UPI00063C958A|nr:hypothetical protein [Klebsiella aerogenes]AVF01491.1 hypothetical protein AM441_23975 [Klebsiella aerogenes]ELA0081908.1 hypothetical protein [Klebsiella aerogenes]KLF47982.1 hypothetical protein YA35_25300 [Klebsiella aerogenes]MDI2670638.1 hypothetical protein [Klebsiella aerogenes]MDI2709340.1 hypothetical protein [Klebsiella aerogenes]
MSLIKTTSFKGLTVINAIYTVEQITIQGGQLDFFVSMKATKTSMPIDGETHGCAYNSSGATPEEQAYAYLKTLPFYADAKDDGVTE